MTSLGLSLIICKMGDYNENRIECPCIALRTMPDAY